MPETGDIFYSDTRFQFTMYARGFDTIVEIKKPSSLWEKIYSGASVKKSINDPGKNLLKGLTTLDYASF
jgi:hypothetical protein